MLDEYRLKQFNDQAKAIDDRTKTKVTRVGDRDTEYGFQNVIEPDGSTSRNGIKTYNADTAPGTPVLATDRSDGLTALTAQKATPSSKVVPKIFGHPEPEKKTVDVWALGLQDIGGEDGSKKLFLLNLKFGASYPIAEWPKKIPACPLVYPDPEDYPDWPTDYPNWRVQLGFRITAGQYPSGVMVTVNSTTDGYVPLGTEIVVVDMYTTPGQSPDDGSGGPLWGVGFYSQDLFSGTSFSAIALYSSDPSGQFGSPYIAPMPSVSNVVILAMTGGPPGGPEPGTEQPTTPRPNEAVYNLSIDPQKIPIVQLFHTPPCDPDDDYGFDKYFKLENVGGTMQMKDYPGDSALGSWRSDAADFRCRSSLRSNEWVSFDVDRSYYWYAEASIGSYTRPQSITLNAPPIEFKVSKVFVPYSGACLVPSNDNRTIIGSYTGTSRPSSLSIVSIAGVSP